MKKHVLLVVASLVAAAGTLGSAPMPEARAQDGQPGEGETLAPTMLVLDASGSMREDDPSGGSRMDAAKAALNAVVDDAPDGAEMGLMAYGTTPGRVANDLELGCKDIETLREVGAVDESGKQALTSAIDEIDGHGYTPIGASLRAAAQELPSKGPRAVVLVSDGEDTCAPPPPCEVAEQLRADGVDLTMHTVGFQVGAKARKELQCIAEAGGGSYVEAPDAETLQQELPKITERALRNYQLDGAPVRGTPQIEDGAPELGPGRYTDTIQAGESKYYRLDVPDDFAVHGSATAVIPRDEGIGGVAILVTEVAIVDERGVVCTSADDRWTQWAPVASVAASWRPYEDAECKSSGPYYLKVYRDGPHDDSDLAYDLELQVILEPPVGDDTGPEATDEPIEFTEPGGEVRDVAGGAGFNDATELPTTSGRYGDMIGYGEIATYKVWLDWGQALAVRAHVGEGQVEGYTDAWTRFEAQVHGPTRTGDRSDWGTGEGINNDAVSLDPIATPPVYYANRYNEDHHDESSYLAGWHYITVWLLPEDSDADIPVEVELSVGGETVDPPAYEKIRPYPAAPTYSEQDLERPKPKQPEKNGDGGESEEVLDDDVASAAAETGALPWVVGAVAVAAIVVVAGLLWRRTSR